MGFWRNRDPDLVLDNKVYLPEFERLQGVFECVIGKSRAIKRAVYLAMVAAQGSSNVLIQGETGTGKELFARCIHKASSRHGGPFVAVNCAAIPENLLESELFGYEEGAFTGARRGGKPGKIELANRGTLLLDEIGEMPLYLQSKLLRVVQERTLERLGGTKTISLDVRLIATTNRDLRRLVAAKEFREDLYYRLCVFPIQLPPLRERKEDIPLLIDHFLREKGLLFGKPFLELSIDAMMALCNYNWPGNVRELENLIEYAINVAVTPQITLSTIAYYFESRELSHDTQDYPEGEVSAPSVPLPLSTQENEGLLLLKALEKYGFTVEGKKKAAKELGISLATLYRRIRKIRTQASYTDLGRFPGIRGGADPGPVKSRGSG